MERKKIIIRKQKTYQMHNNLCSSVSIFSNYDLEELLLLFKEIARSELSNPKTSITPEIKLFFLSQSLIYFLNHIGRLFIGN